MKRREGEFIDEIVRVVKDNNYYLLFSGEGSIYGVNMRGFFPYIQNVDTYMRF